MSKIKDATRNLIVDEATKLFMEKSIIDVKMAEIALDVGIGEATLYRYFGKKQNLVYEAAIKQYKYLLETFENRVHEGTGYEQVRSMYYSYLSLYKTNPGFYNFIYELDSYVLKEASNNKEDYSKALDSFKEVFMKAYNEGLEDHSIKPVDNIEVFYFSTTHALLNLCKKLAHDGTLIEQDNKVDKEAEIKMLIDIILFRLSFNESNIE